MTSREIIKAVLEFEHPPRIGMGLPARWGNDFTGAGRHAPEGSSRSLEPQGSEKWRRLDEWGCIWHSLTDIDKGEVAVGAIEDWAQLKDYRPPDLGVEAEYAAMAKHFAQDQEHFRMGGLSGFTFNIARKIRRMDNYLADLYLERRNIDGLHEIIIAELLKSIDCQARAGADGICFGEDWGTQDRLLVSPAMWREIFKPEFKQLCGRCHDHGMYVFMHSCGKMTAVIEDMIECGIDVFMFDQPALHEIDYLAEQFGGRATFYCPVDIQTTLQTRDREIIRAEAKQLIDKLGRDRFR